MRYYILDDSQPNGFVEVTESEYNAVFGYIAIRSYVHGVYQDEMDIDDVPHEHREAVREAVANKVRRWGEANIDEEANEADYQKALRDMGVEV